MDRNKARARAESYIETARKNKTGGAAEALMHEFGLDSPEGVALMEIAEALLRIPDPETAALFAASKLAKGDWKRHARPENRALMNLAAHALELAGKFSGGKMKKAVTSGLAKGVEALGSKFVLAENIGGALKGVAKLKEKGYLLSYDMLGEGARTAYQAEAYRHAYLKAAEEIGKAQSAGEIYAKDGISVKLSALSPGFQPLKEARIKGEVAASLAEIALAAKKYGIMVTVDAEEAARLDATLAAFEIARRETGYEGLGIAVQAYNKRAPEVIEFLAKLPGQVPVRLVKGAYWDSEVKRAQMLGLADFPVFTKKTDTDAAYLECAKKLLAAPDKFYPQFATHNAFTAAYALDMAEGAEFEFQRLHGMGEELHGQLLEEGVRCRVYAPVGVFRDLLSYLVRRMLENGANNSFVRMLSGSGDFKTGETPPLPPMDIFPGRRNSAGADLGNARETAKLRREIAEFRDKIWYASPVISGMEIGGDSRDSHEPGNVLRKTGEVCEADSSLAAEAVERAGKAFPGWSGRNVEERALCLEKTAALFEKNRAEILALLIREAGKTITDAVAELREAVDFCRYYAICARELMKPRPLSGYTGESNVLEFRGRGVVAAISPWNFPLAIFTGQIAASLVCGNAVVAKPASQTPLVAAFAVRLMHEAGVPPEVLHLLPGGGGEVGMELVKNEGVSGVVFTGGTETAWKINRALAARNSAIAPLIAETGGINAMIIDSTVNPEQTADDVIASAFGSAGQRCSALRMVYVQEEIADEFFALLSGAASSLETGNPEDFGVDLGPLIDKKAAEAVTRHISRMEKTARAIMKGAVSGNAEKRGGYVAPHIFEIGSISELPGEIFGPVLHAARFKWQGLDKVIADINSTGYALTLGVQTRIEERAAHISALAAAGNVYINRPMTGAVVGLQPFGGYGLSGTGPKAGGPHYLSRFVVERVITVNTAAMGGNVGLLGMRDEE